MLITSTCTELLAGTQTSASMQGQLQAQGATTVLPNSSAWLQQAGPQNCSVLVQGGTAQHTSLPQHSPWEASVQVLQRVVADPALHQPQGSASNADVSRLRDVLQGLLRSLPAAGEPANSTRQQLTMQGPCAVLGMPQQAMNSQDAQQQHVYLSSTGQQLLLVGGGPKPMQLEQGYVYACAAEGSSNVQVQSVMVPQQGVLGGISVGQGLAPASTAVCQEMQADRVLVYTEHHAGPDMRGSSVYGMPNQVAIHQASNSNVQAACASSAVLGPETPGCFTAGANQAWHDSGSPTCASSSAGSPPLVPSKTSTCGLVSSSKAQQQLQQPSSASPKLGSSPSTAAGQTRAPAAFARPTQGRSAPAESPATASAAGQQEKPAAGKTVVSLPAPWATTPLLEGLQQLWSSAQVDAAKGGCIFTSAERTAWHPTADVTLTVQDLFDFRILKYVIHRLDTKQQVRVQLMKRLHAAVNFGGGELKHVYFEVRCIVSEMLHRASGRTTGLVRLALALQEALSTGRVCKPAAAAE